MEELADYKLESAIKSFISERDELFLKAVEIYLRKFFNEEFKKRELYGFNLSFYPSTSDWLKLKVEKRIGNEKFYKSFRIRDFIDYFVEKNVKEGRGKELYERLKDKGFPRVKILKLFGFDGIASYIFRSMFDSYRRFSLEISELMEKGKRF